jgi:hypothetical protein
MPTRVLVVNDEEPFLEILHDVFSDMDISVDVPDGFSPIGNLISQV